MRSFTKKFFLAQCLILTTATASFALTREDLVKEPDQQCVYSSGSASSPANPYILDRNGSWPQLIKIPDQASFYLKYSSRGIACKQYPASAINDVYSSSGGKVWPTVLVEGREIAAEQGDHWKLERGKKRKFFGKLAASKPDVVVFPQAILDSIPNGADLPKPTPVQALGARATTRAVVAKPVQLRPSIKKVIQNRN